tara:strand:- start:1933 stop:3141 length:1209 start_codon:yes stop_codon:yes gene_type:complete
MQTFTGFEYIKIDLANHYGLGKKTFQARISWVDDNMNDLEALVDVAEEKPLYMAALMALRNAQAGVPSGHLVGLDACSSGIQIMGTLIGCPVTCESTGLVNPNVRADIYTDVTAVMNIKLQQEGIRVAPDRDDIKQALMTHFYGSTGKPKEIFGEETIELAKFYEAQAEVAPGAVTTMEMLLGAWQPFGLSHDWALPDGFEAKCKVMVPVDVKIEVDELNHSTFTHRFYENEGTESGLSIAANIVHSIDGMIVREMNRRCNYDKDVLQEAQQLIRRELAKRGPVSAFPDTSTFISLVEADNLVTNKTPVVSYSDSDLLRLDYLISVSLLNKPFPLVCVHDEFKAHANNMNHVRQHYIEIFAELGNSNLLADILTQVHQSPITVDKIMPTISTLIRRSNYALS